MQKPTRYDLEMAAHNTVPDLIAPNLDVLFCGINPGLYSGATGHHFARPGNRFWPALHAAGFTPYRFSPSEEEALLELGYGITNLVERTTAAAAELTKEELALGGEKLTQKTAFLNPGYWQFWAYRPTAWLLTSQKHKWACSQESWPIRCFGCCQTRAV